jgi:hypothetical protein
MSEAGNNEMKLSSAALASIESATKFVCGVLFFAGGVAATQQLQARENQRGHSGNQFIEFRTMSEGEGGMAVIQKPTTPIALFENIRSVLDRHFLLREDFYTEENLATYFGGSNIVWRVPNSSQKQWLFLSAFDGLIEPTKNGEGISISLTRTVRPDGKTESKISVGITSEDRRLVFENVVGIFGSEWKTKVDDEEVRRWHHGGYRTPTHPHGNAAIQYTKENGSIRTVISMHFRSNGVLERATFVEMQ